MYEGLLSYQYILCSLFVMRPRMLDDGTEGNIPGLHIERAKFVSFLVFQSNTKRAIDES